jgi:eukaryotic-like serine/threonine-protein kinase
MRFDPEVHPPENGKPGTKRFLPHQQREEGEISRSGWTLTPELQSQITRRLRLIALTYSFAFFAADIFPAVLMGAFPGRFQHPVEWVPSFCSILAGLIVAIVVSRGSLSWLTKIHLGLGFEVAGSYGIALAQYILPPEVRNEPHMLHVLSPSWVAIWMLFYSIVVPSPPRKTLIALILSASAPLVVISISLRAAHLTDLMPLDAFLLGHALPYAICAGMAYLGARVVYNLGTDVSRARELGSYRLEERLGQGGMGEVWRASHRMLARPAAIKFIRPETIAGMGAEDAQRLLRRFELEARATASLTSAHTVNLYDFGVSDDGSFYYVMELLDGLDCEELVKRFGPIPASRAAHLLAQICESLDEAHGKGLIHRDVKPANVYVCKSGTRTDFVKVLDFGLVADHRPSDARLTQPDQALGTPQFMPPEMALGKPIDARVDVYGLGCVAFWLTTGRPVFEGEGFYDVVSRHLHAMPEPPSRHVGSLPREWDAIVLSCLEKDPERRPRTARDLAARLREIPLGDRWSEQDSEDWWRENLSGPAVDTRDFTSESRTVPI